VLIEEGLALWDAGYSVAKIASTFLRPGIRMFAYVVNTLHDVFEFTLSCVRFLVGWPMLVSHANLSCAQYDVLASVRTREVRT